MKVAKPVNIEFEFITNSVLTGSVIFTQLDAFATPGLSIMINWLIQSRFTHNFLASVKVTGPQCCGTVAAVQLQPRQPAELMTWRGPMSYSAGN